MSRTGVRTNATFDPAAYLKSISEMFAMLEPAQQRELAEKMSHLPRHIHQLASSGQIAVPMELRR